MSSQLPTSRENPCKLSCLRLALEAVKSLNKKLALIYQDNVKNEYFITSHNTNKDNFENKNLIQNEEKIKANNDDIRQRVGLSTFNGNGETIFDLTFTYDLGESLDCRLKKIYANGGTNLYNGLAQAWEIMRKVCRSKGEEKILFLTDIQEAEDPKFFQLLLDITKQGVSVDIIGIGQNLNLSYSQKVADIKNVSLHTVSKQEEMRKILVDDFEFNFFPIAKDFKIEFYSNNIEVLKTYGTGYDNVKNEVNNLEASELLKDQIKLNQSSFVHFNLLRSYYRKRYQKVPMFALQTITNFLKFNKRCVAEFEKLYPSETQMLNLNDENNNGENKFLKMVKGNMVLLKAKLVDLDLHRKLGRTETAEVVFNYIDCQDESNKRLYFPVYFDFGKTENNKNIIDDRVSGNNALVAIKNEQLNVERELNFSLTDVKPNKFGCKINDLFEAEFNSNANRIAVCLYYSAYFLRRTLKQYGENNQELSKGFRLNEMKEKVSTKGKRWDPKEIITQGFLNEESFQRKKAMLFSLLDEKLKEENDASIKAQLIKEIQSLVTKLEKKIPI